MKINKCSLFFIISGALCIALGFSLFVYNRISAEKAFEASQQTVTLLTEKLSEQKEKSDFPTDNYDRKMPEITIDGKNYIGVLEIKELDLKLPIASDLSYEMLDISPCLYSGTIYRKNLVIAAHNYEKHFGKINSFAISVLGLMKMSLTSPSSTISLLSIIATLLQIVSITFIS